MMPFMGPIRECTDAAERRPTVSTEGSIESVAIKELADHLCVKIEQRIQDLHVDFMAAITRLEQSSAPTPAPPPPLKTAMKRPPQPKRPSLAATSSAPLRMNSLVGFTATEELPIYYRVQAPPAKVDKSKVSLSKALVEAQESSLRTHSIGRKRSERGSMIATRTVAYLDSYRQDTLFNRIAKSGQFEGFFGCLIILNTIFIGIQTDQEARYGTETIAGLPAFEGVNATFSILFLIELLVRLVAEKSSFFWGCDSRVWWNLLDSFIVFCSLLELGATLFVSVGNVGQFRILRVVRITRLIKVVRVTRIIRFIRALRTMVHQLMSTMRSLMWAMILLGLIIYVFAILMTQAYTDYAEFNEVSTGLQRYWCSLPRSMLSLFQSATGGVSWEDILDPLEDVGLIGMSLVILYVCFTQLAVLNVLTGVFCQSAIDSAAHDHELLAQSMLENKSQYIQKIKAIFEDLDLDGNGLVPVEEFKERFKDLKVRAYFETLDVDTTDLKALFHLMDLEQEATVDLEDFVEFCLRLKGAASNLSMAKLSRSHDVMMARFKTFIGRVEDKLAKLEWIVDWQYQQEYGGNSKATSPKMSPRGSHNHYGMSEKFSASSFAFSEKGTPWDFETMSVSEKPTSAGRTYQDTEMMVSASVKV